MDNLSPFLLQANRESPSFAQIPKEMCLIVDRPDKVKALPKSSKGTIQRGLAYDIFRQEIEILYSTRPSGDAEIEKRNLADIESFLHQLILDVAKSSRKAGFLGNTTDLFSWGVDSLMATRIRSGIQRVSLCPSFSFGFGPYVRWYTYQNLNVGGTKLPNNIVFEKPSITR